MLQIFCDKTNEWDKSLPFLRTEYYLRYPFITNQCINSVASFKKR